MRTRVLAMLVAGALPLGAAPLHTQEVVVGGAAEEQDKPLDEAWAREQGVVLDYDEPPTPIKTTEPAYPKDALEKKVEGVVTVALRHRP